MKLVFKKSNGKRQLRLGKGIWLKTGDVKLWTQTHGERKNRVQSFIKQHININWIRLCFMWVSSITNNHYYSTLISISKSVSCHFSHLFIPFISSLSFFFSWNEKSISNCFLLPNFREARVSTFVCFKVWTSSWFSHYQWNEWIKLQTKVCFLRLEFL